jgi:hypothetical protein
MVEAKQKHPLDPPGLRRLCTVQLMLLSKQNGLVDLVHCKMLSGHRVMKPSRSPPSVQVELISESDSQYTLNIS